MHNIISLERPCNTRLKGKFISSSFTHLLLTTLSYIIAFNSNLANFMKHPVLGIESKLPASKLENIREVITGWPRKLSNTEINFADWSLKWRNDPFLLESKLFFVTISTILSSRKHDENNVKCVLQKLQKKQEKIKHILTQF